MILAEFEPNKVDEFPYVVAKLWRSQDLPEWKNLYIYHYGGQVLYGSVKDSEGFLEYVKSQSEIDETNPHKIYRISFQEVGNE